METQTDSQTEKLISKIRKLLALSTSSNEHEAAAAAAKAAELMRENDLEEAQLRLDEGDGQGPAPIGDDLFDVHGGRLTAWKTRLASACARSVGARVYYSREYIDHKWQRVVKIFGRTTAIQTASYQYKYLVNEIDRLASQHKGMGKAWINAFRLGATITIDNRLSEERRVYESALKKAETSTALAVVNRDLEVVNEGWNARKKGMKTIHIGQVSSGAGLAAGQAAGHDIALGGGKGIGAAPRQIGGRSS